MGSASVGLIMSNANIFASRYQLYLPSKEELKAQLCEVIEEKETDKP